MKSSSKRSKPGSSAPTSASQPPGSSAQGIKRRIPQWRHDQRARMRSSISSREIKAMWPEEDRKYPHRGVGADRYPRHGCQRRGQNDKHRQDLQTIQGRWQSKVLLGACDTFRAGAVRQLEIWSERLGVDIVKGPRRLRSRCGRVRRLLLLVSPVEPMSSSSTPRVGSRPRPG